MTMMSWNVDMMMVAGDGMATVGSSHRAQITVEDVGKMLSSDLLVITRE